jgi:hypothetical protein
MRHNAELDCIAHRYAGKFKLQVVERDFAIWVNYPLGHQTEDIFSILEGWRNHELSKEGLFFFLGSLEASGGNLTRGAMDLVVVIAIDFAAEDLPGIEESLDIFSGAGSD